MSQGSTAAEFPSLDHFLNTYMHQDWMIFGSSLAGVVATFSADEPLQARLDLKDDIAKFVRKDDIETSYYVLFPNSVLPSGLNMSVKDWLKSVSSQIT